MKATLISRGYYYLHALAGQEKYHLTMTKLWQTIQWLEAHHLS